MEDLKPCPFCGSKEVIPYFADGIGNEYRYEGENVDVGASPWIHCHGCDSDWFTPMTGDAAIEAWNRRASNDNQ